MLRRKCEERGHGTEQVRHDGAIDRHDVALPGELSELREIGAGVAHEIKNKAEGRVRKLRKFRKS
jgi:hypothetical protein